VGATVNASNPVVGDLLTAGGTTIISGKVSQDIMAVGGTLTIVGGEAEDLRVGGGNITIGEKVNGEIMAAGGQIAITSDTVIAKDSYIAGGSIVFNGTENGNLTLVGRQIQIDGTVNGNLMITRAEKVTFGSRAIVKGTVEYSAPQEATIESGAQISATPIFHKIESTSGKARASFMNFLKVLAVLKLIAVLTAAYLLWFLRRRDMVTAVESVYKRFWSVLLRGFAVLILVPVASIILLFTVVGWIPAGVMLATYVALLMVAAPVAVLIATSLLMALFKKSHTDLKWYYILVGAIILSLVTLIPFVGGFICFIIFLLSLGAVSGILKTKFSA
jgi:hypothetical protein